MFVRAIDWRTVSVRGTSTPAGTRDSSAHRPEKSGLPWTATVRAQALKIRHASADLADIRIALLDTIFGPAAIIRSTNVLLCHRDERSDAASGRRLRERHVAQGYGGPAPPRSRRSGSRDRNRPRDSPDAVRPGA